MKKTLLLCAALIVQGCSTVNGQPAELNNVGKIVLGIVVVGGLLAIASSLDDPNEPDATIVSKGPSGMRTTEIYYK